MPRTSLVPWLLVLRVNCSSVVHCQFFVRPEYANKGHELYERGLEEIKTKQNKALAKETADKRREESALQPVPNVPETAKNARNGMSFADYNSTWV